MRHSGLSARRRIIVRSLVRVQPGPYERSPPLVRGPTRTVNRGWSQGAALRFGEEGLLLTLQRPPPPRGLPRPLKQASPNRHEPDADHDGEHESQPPTNDQSGNQDGRYTDRERTKYP